MKLEDYLKYRFQQENINIKQYIAIQNLELLKFICKKEKCMDQYKDLCKKYIKIPEPETQIEYIPTISENSDLFDYIKLPNKSYFDRQKHSIYIKIILDEIRNIFKNTPLIFSNIQPTNMPTENQFNHTFDLVFGNHYDGTNRWRSKKAKLKRKYTEKTDGKYTDYELILFNYIISLHERLG